MTNTATVTQEVPSPSLHLDAGHLAATGTESAPSTQAVAAQTSAADSKAPSAAPPPYVSGQTSTNETAEIQPAPAAAATAAPTSTVNEKSAAHKDADKKSSSKNQQPPPTRVSLLHHIGRDPALVICPACKNMGVTNVKLHAGDQVAMWSLITCLCLGLIFAWIPCVIPSCKDAEHYCSTCGVLLGTCTGKGVVELSETGHMENVEEVKRRLEQMKADRRAQEGESAWTKPGLEPAAQPAGSDLKSQAQMQSQETGVVAQTPAEKSA